MKVESREKYRDAQKYINHFSCKLKINDAPLTTSV